MSRDHHHTGGACPARPRAFGEFAPHAAARAYEQRTPEGYLPVAVCAYCRTHFSPRPPTEPKP